MDSLKYIKRLDKYNKLKNTSAKLVNRATGTEKPKQAIIDMINEVLNAK